MADGMQRVEFTPNEVGPHVISLLYGGQPVPGSPQTTMVYDPNRVRLIDVTQDGGIGQQHGFTGEHRVLSRHMSQYNQSASQNNRYSQADS